MEMGETRKDTWIFPPLLDILSSGRGTALNSPPSFLGVLTRDQGKLEGNECPGS